MKPTFEMKPLSQRKRRFIFAGSILLFCIAVPISVFYAIGYRFDFTDKIQSIKSVGGMYVRNDTQNTEMFIDSAPVIDVRIFQKAAYIQNLEAGMHRIYVQGNSVQTWVKELPVYAHFVTEVSSFNMPKVPQIRLVTQWYDPQTGAGIVHEYATSTKFAFASTTNVLMFASTTATSSYTKNPEYTYIKTLFASSSERMALLHQKSNVSSKKPFTFNLDTVETIPEEATSTKNWKNFTLFKKGSNVYMAWNGSAEKAPYYYCVQYENKTVTTLEYGSHVYEALVASVASSSPLESHVGQRICRNEIRIDNLNKEVVWFDFYPNSTDLVLMQLVDGLSVVEVDDRAWQNTQLLYPGKNIEALQDGGRIYVHDGEYYLEVLTEVSIQ